MKRESKLGAFVVGTTLALGGGLAGCDQPENLGEGTQVESGSQELYLNGPKFNNGIVHICFTNGTDALKNRVKLHLANSWAKAANITFTGWDACNTMLNESVVRIRFEDNSVGASSVLGKVDPKKISPFPIYSTGFTDVTLIQNDTDVFEQHFRYEIIHEIGHALGFAHEQERPDNWDSNGNPIYCSEVQGSRKAMPGGTYQTSYFDVDSIMSYCQHWKTFLSRGDIQGARNTYGRKSSMHGFMIRSDNNTNLAINAWGGAKEGTDLRLHNGCAIGNPDCTWSYENGMLVSDTDPSLAINAWGGATEGVQLKLTRACKASNPDCTWTYSKGQFVSDRNPALAINAWGGAVHGANIKITSLCTASNPDCTWTLPNVMLSSVRNTALKWNAFGGAAFGTEIRLHQDCDTTNTDCTWTIKKGMIYSDTNSSLAVNAFGGASNLVALKLHNGCTASNPDCTWTWKKGELLSDRNTALAANANGGAVHLSSIILNSACTASNQDCLFFGRFAKN